MHPEAKTGFDYHDDFNSPRFIEYLEVKFPKKYLGMTYAKDVVPTTENHVWLFNIETNTKEKITSVSWDNSYFGTGKEIYLLDVSEHRITDMKNESHYEFMTAATKEFKIVYGIPEFVKQELLPMVSVLYNPYPNPFTDQTTIAYALPKEAERGGAVIEIYNALGSRISSMNTPSQPGLAQWIWDSTGQTSGMYFVRLKMGDETVMKKIIKR